jgi:hypothetical protein
MPIQIVAKRNGKRVILWRGIARAAVARACLIVASFVIAWRFFNGQWMHPITCMLIGIAIVIFFVITVLLKARTIPLDGLPELPGDSKEHFR